jgi:hypothetical protein
VPIKHDFRSDVSDARIPEGWVKPGNWNADHVLDGLLTLLDGIAVQPNTFPAVDADGNGSTINFRRSSPPFCRRSPAPSTGSARRIRAGKAAMKRHLAKRDFGPKWKRQLVAETAAHKRGRDE